METKIDTPLSKEKNMIIKREIEKVLSLFFPDNLSNIVQIHQGYQGEVRDRWS